MASDVGDKGREKSLEGTSGFHGLAPEVFCLDLRPPQVQERLGNVVQCPAGSVGIGC